MLCPFCGGKTRIKLLPETRLIHFPLFCPKCRRTAIINAANQNIEIIKPDV